MAESKDTRELCRRLESRGCLSYCLIGGRHNRPGWADRLLVTPHGRTWLIEFKTMKAINRRRMGLRKEQREVNGKLAGMGARVAICGIEGKSGFIVPLYREGDVEAHFGDMLAYPFNTSGEFLNVLNGLG